MIGPPPPVFSEIVLVPRIFTPIAVAAASAFERASASALAQCVAVGGGLLVQRERRPVDRVRARRRRGGDHAARAGGVVDRDAERLVAHVAALVLPVAPGVDALGLEIVLGDACTESSALSAASTAFILVVATAWAWSLDVARAVHGDVHERGVRL